MAVITLLDIAKLNGSDPMVPLIEESLPSSPEFSLLPARAIAGTNFKVTVRTAFPVVAFRAVNSGSTAVKSTYVNKTFECFYIDGQMQMDKAAAGADDRGSPHIMGIEAQGTVMGAMQTIGKQVWYGNTTGGSGDVLGFPGASQVVDSTLVIDAGGTTANTGSSVYFVVALPGFFEILVGRNQVFATGEWREQTVYDANSKPYTAMVNSLEGYVGAAFYNKYALVRIKNLTADSGKGLTDSLLAQAIALLPVGVTPTHVFMTRRSRRQLQISRTVTLFGQGTGRPDQSTVAPIPTSYDGIPIVATDSLLDTEALS